MVFPFSILILPKSHNSLPFRQTKRLFYRVAGGKQLLTDTLVQNLEHTEIHLKASVVAIHGTQAGVQVQLQDGTTSIDAKAVVCIPRQLAVSQIQYSPNLPDAVYSLFASVQTWMAGAIKYTVEDSLSF